MKLKVKHYQTLIYVKLFNKYKFLGQENITSILLIKSSGNDFIVKDSILLKVN